MRDQLKLEPFVARREWTVDDIPVLTAELSLPRPVGESGRTFRRLDRYYQLYARSYLRYCERWLFPQSEEACRLAMETSAPLPQDSARLFYHVTCNGGGVLSLYTESAETCGGRTERRRQGDTWDLLTGYPVPLSACFPRKFPWRKALLRQSETEIDRQERAGVARYYDGWRRLLRRNFNPEHFYLSETEFFWFWQMFTIAPSAEGIPVFSMPFGENDCFFPGIRDKIVAEQSKTTSSKR
jgi:hypothetical protein